MPKVFIILLNWNGLKDTLDCLRSLFSLDYPEFRVIVVDNCSADDSVATIRNSFPQVIVLANERNLGFTGGNNVGIRHAVGLGADYVWLLNNDTVVAPDSLRRLVEQGEGSPETGLLSPAIYCFDDTDRKQFVGSYVKWQTLEIVYPDRAFQREEEFRYGGDNVCLWGTALLIKRSTLEQIGDLDDAYFAYWEDTEYSLRALTHRLQNRVCPSARIYHKSPLDNSSSPKGKHYYYLMLRNRLFLRKYLKGSLSAALFYREYFSTLIAESGWSWRSGDRDTFTACVNGAWHGITKVTGPMTDHPPPPGWFTSFFKLTARCHPFLISYLVGGKFRLLGEAVAKRLQRTKSPPEKFFTGPGGGSKRENRCRTRDAAH